MFITEVIDENPMAVPKNGALQGVAINVAKTPEKKKLFLLFESTILFSLFNIFEDRIISKKPSKFNENSKTIIVMVIKKK